MPRVMPTLALLCLLAACAPPDEVGQRVGQSLYDASVQTGRAISQAGQRTGQALQDAGSNLRGAFGGPPGTVLPPPDGITQQDLPPPGDSAGTPANPALGY